MEILATARHEMGGEFKLAKVSDDFYMYGTQKEFESWRCYNLEFRIQVGSSRYYTKQDRENNNIYVKKS